MFRIVETEKFPNMIKKYFEKNVKKCQASFKYIDSKIVSFEKCNIKYQTAFRIIIYNGNKIFEVLYTGSEDCKSENFYLNSLSNPITLKEISKIIIEMT